MRKPRCQPLTSRPLPGHPLGTQSLGDAFEDLGQTVGHALVDGVLFGKGQNEQEILGNFNQLLGVQASGLFGAQGNALGTTLASSIASSANSALQSVGIDLGGYLRLGLWKDGGRARAGADFSNVIAGEHFRPPRVRAARLGLSLARLQEGRRGSPLAKALASVLGIGGE